jgi:hypothetical protein
MILRESIKVFGPQDFRGLEGLLQNGIQRFEINGGRMRNKYYLYLVELGGIQDFIFSSNNLQVNIGASALVRAITDQWIFDLLSEKNINVHIEPGSVRLTFSDETIEQDDLDAEIVYIGGGNALILFKDEELIHQFDKKLSQRILVEAQGISLISHSIEVDLNADNLKEKNAELHEKLGIKKTSLATQSSLAGLGVSARCVFSADPAGGIWKDPGKNAIRVSDRVIAKLRYRKLAETYLAEITEALVGFSDLNYGFISNFDDFGEKGVSSYIAIVHLDGNRIGKRIENLGEGFNFPAENRKYLKLLSAFSESCKSAAKNALVTTLEKLLMSLEKEEGIDFIQQKYDLAGERLQHSERRLLSRVNVDVNKLPFRPLVFGGDDVTFICDGRLGLALAKEYLVNYGAQVLEEGKEQKKAPVGRAGIAIIPNHFPFSQGYEMAEALSGYAKKAGNNGTEPSLDWHIGKNGIVRPLGETRNVQYPVAYGNLLSRPVKLSAASDYDFSTFEYIVKTFQSANDWNERRNKVKALYALMREGGEKVASFLTNGNLPPLPTDSKIQNLGNLSKEGWYSRQCYYFDALEALDFYIPLEV